MGAAEEPGKDPATPWERVGQWRAAMCQQRLQISVTLLRYDGKSVYVSVTFSSREGGGLFLGISKCVLESGTKAVCNCEKIKIKV